MAIPRKKKSTSTARQKFEPQQVHCPNCGFVQFETTPKYTPDAPPHPGMVSMMEPYLSWGWELPPADESAGYGCLECGECGSQLAPNGKLKVL
jgi:predicted RNA-binding Zn-ribbon protein involved in translation (DUF1610 family)